MMKVDSIDTRHGTLNKPEFSNGNTLPYTGTPFGMNYFILQNQTGSNWHFDPNYPIFQGIRLTHQPSPWMGDFSSLLITPVTGEQIKPELELNQTSYKMDQAIFQPHYFKADLLRYRLQVELVPTRRGGRINLKNYSEKKMGLVLHTDREVEYTIDDNNRLIGKLQYPVNDNKSILDYYFIFDFDQPSIKNTVYSIFENDSKKRIDELKEFTTNYLYISFDTNSQELNLSMGTSFISEKQALLNLEREVINSSFEQLKNNIAEEWEYYLGKIDVQDKDQKKVNDFNQYLYRMFLFPQTFYELTKEGEPIHYDVYNETIQHGKFYTNNGYWDTYKTVYPLFSLIIPKKYQEILEGIEHFYKESGHLPKWISPDEQGLMPGTLVNAVIADAAVKGLLDEKQLHFFLDAMIKEATEPSKNSKFGRSGVTDTLTYGYVTNDKVESVNQTQDNAYSDFCIRQVASLINKKQVKSEYEGQSLNYRNLFDTSTGFMRGKNREGKFTDPFIPENWSYDYTEGSAWQNSLAVFHNFQDYIDLFGGKDKFLDHLINLTNEEPVFEIGNYGKEIHEMSELATADFGQLAISNQPSFHIPYLFSYVGKPAYTQLIVKQLCENAFSTSFDGYPGDEDNGSLSGWYIFNMIGFYPVTPGTDQYVIGIPQFDKSTIHLPNNKKFTITARNNVESNNFIQEIKLNNKPYDKLYVTHEDIISGNNMTVKLGLLPPNKNIGVEQLPYSMKNE